MFSVKDKDLFGMSNQYIAECFLAFKDIEDVTTNNNVQIEQTHMKLTRPTNLGRIIEPSLAEFNYNLCYYLFSLKYRYKLYSCLRTSSW